MRSALAAAHVYSRLQHMQHTAHTRADEIDAIGTKRFDSELSGDREVQRTMLELLNQLDGFSSSVGLYFWSYRYGLPAPVHGTYRYLVKCKIRFIAGTRLSNL